jgi:hypothetical protein
MVAWVCNGLGSVIARYWATSYTRRASCYKAGNRYAARRVMLAPFPLKTPPLSKSRAHSPLRSRHTISAGKPSSTAILQSSTCCARFSLDTQGRIPLSSATSEASSYRVLFVAFMLAACASTGVIPKADGTYAIEKKVSRTFSGSAESVRADVYQEAADYCGRERKVVETVKLEITPGSGFTKTGNVFLKFRCK